MLLALSVLTLLAPSLSVHLDPALQAELATLGVPLDSSCSYRVISSFVSRCEQLDTFADSERSQMAVRLTQCVLEDLPRECYRNKEGDIARCVKQLATNSVQWTTYFGYLNLVESVCHWYSQSLESERLVATYHDVAGRFESLQKAMQQMASEEMVAEHEKRMEAVVDRISAELDRKAGAVSAQIEAALVRGRSIRRQMEQLDSQLVAGHRATLATLQREAEAGQRQLQQQYKSVYERTRTERVGAAAVAAGVVIGVVLFGWRPTLRTLCLIMGLISGRAGFRWLATSS